MSCITLVRRACERMLRKPAAAAAVVIQDRSLLGYTTKFCSDDLIMSDSDRDIVVERRRAIAQ